MVEECDYRLKAVLVVAIAPGLVNTGQAKVYYNQLFSVRVDKEVLVGGAKVVDAVL